MIRRHIMALRFGLMLGDGLTAVLVFLGVSVLRFRDGDPAEPWSAIGIDIRLGAVVFAATWVTILWMSGLYRLTVRWRLFTEVRALARATVVVAALTLSFLFLVKQVDVSRLFLVFLLLAQPAVTLLGRTLLRAAFKRAQSAGGDPRYMLGGPMSRPAPGAVRVDTDRAAVVALPFLVALGPIFYLWAGNADIVRPASTAPALIATVFIVSALFWVLRLVTRSTARSAILLSALSIAVLSFGYQADALETAFPTGDPDLLLRLLLAANVVVFIVVIAAVALTPIRLIARIAKFGAYAAAMFVLLSLPPIVGHLRFEASQAGSRPPPAEASTVLPDIYYIVLDGYGRGDVLQELYGHDNGPFLAALEAQEFYVADESFSNYAITPLSLASALHMRYMDDDEAERILSDGARPMLMELIHQPEIVRRLRPLGYRYVHFGTMWWGTEEAPLADIAFSRDDFLQSEFSLVLLGTTLPGRFLLDLSPSWHETSLYTLRHLRDVAAIDGPTFTMAHLLIPHPPYVFDADGNVLRHEATLSNGWDNPVAYVEQLRFLNDQLEVVVAALTDASAVPPVIILQGDHGPAQQLVEGSDDIPTVYWERMGILNAYLVPDTVRSSLYPEISPVNTFRLILNDLAKTDLELLADRSFFSWTAPSKSPAVAARHHELREVTDLLRSR